MGDKDIVKLLKTKLKRKIIKILLIISCVLLVITSVIAVISSITEFMGTGIVQVLNGARSAVRRALGAENWINLDSEIDMEDPITGEIKKQTIVDFYIEQLSSLGISLGDLRLIGDAEYTDEAMQNPENKEKIQKYMKEFIRADIISQEIHKTKGDRTIFNSQKEHLIDGGIYVYRTISEINTDGMNGSGNATNPTDSTEIYQGTIKYNRMEYKPYDEFIKCLEEQNISEKRGKEIATYFTINDDDMLLFYNVKTVKTKLEIWRGETSNEEEVTLTLAEPIDYKAMIAPYAMPYEFLIDLCMITQNPEFVYHVARLARNTKINLMIQDTTFQTITEEVINASANTYSKTVPIGTSADSVSWGLDSSQKDKQVYYKWKSVTEETSQALITRVNSWSYQLLYQYTNIVTDKIYQNGPNSVGNREYGQETEVHRHYTTGEVVSNTYRKYVAEDCQQIITERQITNEYRPALLVGGTNEDGEELGHRKSKQFLGLLVNEEGKCHYDCFKDPSLVDKCIKESVFKDGGNYVSYRIPNSIKEEIPFFKLNSNKTYLFDLLQLQLTEDSSNENKSAYNEKMQGLIEYIQYLLTFPENEEDLPDEEEMDDLLDDYEEEIVIDYGAGFIVKTDEQGAAPTVTREELINGLRAWLNNRQANNAISVIDTVLKGQDDYKVNAVFMYALMRAETSMGTSASPKTNWTSWIVGHEYDTAQQCIETTMKGIATGKYYFTQEKFSVYEIGEVYCTDPPHPAWAQEVNNYMTELYNAMGKTVSSSGKYIEYKQGDYKQQDVQYMATPEGGWGTIADKGCMPTSIAIIASGYGKTDSNGNIYNPRTIITGNILPKISNYTNAKNAFKKLGLNLGAQTYTSAEGAEATILNHLRGGNPILVHCDKGYYTGGGHYMTLIGVNEDKVLISNPGSRKAEKNGYVTVQQLIERNVDWFATVSP